MPAPSQLILPEPVVAQPQFLVDANGNPITGSNGLPVIMTNMASLAINDGINTTLKQTVGQFHNADNQALPTTAYGALTGGVTQLINFLGALDRLRETGQDGVGSVGIQAGAASLGQAVLTTSNTPIAQGAASATINPANMLGMTLYNLISVDTGASLEFAVITSLGVGNSITITPLNGSPVAPAFKFAHNGPYNVNCFIFNQERDANGELDIPRGPGMAVAMPMLSLSAGQGSSNPVIAVRERGVQGLGDSVPIAISSGFTQGSLSGVLASVPVGLGQGVALYLTGGPGTPFERVLTALNYTPGSTNIILDPATPVLGAARTQAQFKIFQAGMSSALFFPEGEGGEMEMVADFASGKGGFVQNAGVNSAPYINSPLEAPGLDNGQTLDKTAGNQNLALINAAASTTTQTTSDLTNINARGVKVFVNMITAGSGSVTILIQAKDPFGNYFTLLSSVPLVTNGQTILTVYPGLLTIANTSLNDVLPRIWRIQANANNNNPTTYTVGAMTIL